MNSQFRVWGGLWGGLHKLSVCTRGHPSFVCMPLQPPKAKQEGEYVVLELTLAYSQVKASSFTYPCSAPSKDVKEAN